MKAIVAVDKNWGIGSNNDMLFYLKEDLKFFKATTTNKVVVMGINTLMSLPNSKPLPNRVNIVLSETPVDIQNVIVCHGNQDLVDVLNEFDDDDVFVIGGAYVYANLIDCCNQCFVTKIDAEKPAEKFMTNLDSLDNWVCTQTSNIFEQDSVRFTFNVYTNNNVKDIEV